MKIEVSIGEVIDKFTILSIKKEKITDLNKLKNVDKEYSYLKEIIEELPDITMQKRLFWVNSKLWVIEDMLRDFEKNNVFDKNFILLARLVYRLNDLRFEIKNRINIKFDSDIREEKSYSK